MKKVGAVSTAKFVASFFGTEVPPTENVVPCSSGFNREVRSFFLRD